MSRIAAKKIIGQYIPNDGKYAGLVIKICEPHMPKIKYVCSGSKHQGHTSTSGGHSWRLQRK